MSALIVEPNLTNPYVTYATVLSAHENLTEEQSAILNVRLVLILINHIGDNEVLLSALNLALTDLIRSPSEE